MKRREFIAVLLGTAATLLAFKGRAMAFFGDKKDTGEKEVFAYQLSDAQWKEKLTSEQYRILRKAGTERSGSSPLNTEKRKGIFHCAGCDWPLFSSAHKYDSGTGWPSFWQPINDKALRSSIDHKLFAPRNEIHCANCGGHLGHVFEDGPPPTGLRYCMNGTALVFIFQNN